jgi:hypothetical protein
MRRSQDAIVIHYIPQMLQWNRLPRWRGRPVGPFLIEEGNPKMISFVTTSVWFWTAALLVGIPNRHEHDDVDCAHMCLEYR